MLFDDEEISIMAAALQPPLRAPDHGASDFEQIIADFFRPELLRGARILDLGPGQYDFARLATAAGASVTAIDHDPAIVALGKKRGHEVILADVLDLDWRTLAQRFDGLFT